MEETRLSNVYQDSSWSYDFLQSLNVDCLDQQKDRQESLKAKVTDIVENYDTDLMVLLQLIDNIQRLGLGYHFEKTVRKALTRRRLNVEITKMSLHGVALTFRLLRQNGYEISQDVFKPFMDNNGRFTESLRSDIMGMISLYEACFLSFEGEGLLAKAKEFATKQMKDFADHTSHTLTKQVCHVLELPSHRRMVRLEAREYIESYYEREAVNHMLLELAVLDFNMVQSAVKSELQAISRWWCDTRVSKELSFIRDRITESYFCSIGLVSDPRYSKCRKELTKIIALIIIIDDVYDVYGSLHELELFTRAVDRWNLEEAVTLSKCMTFAFKLLYETVNKMAYDNFHDQGFSTISSLRKAWADLCKSFLLEAKWGHSKQQPKFKDYMDNAWVSSGGVVLLIHAYCLITENITNEGLHCLDNHHNILRHPSMIFRLTNDLSSSRADMEGENVVKSIPCYVKDFNISVELAHKKIRRLVDVTWEKMNKDIQAANAIFTKPFIDIVLNLARTSHYVYQHGDAYRAPNDASREQVLKLLVEPICLPLNGDIRGNLVPKNNSTVKDSRFNIYFKIVLKYLEFSS